MIKRLLRLFREYRELENGLEREAALSDSLERYIEALEGRDGERVLTIKSLEQENREQAAKLEELESKYRAALAVFYEALETAAELRERLAGLRPDRKEEP
jgi:predicted  nucleic acid-binding Zn-ribbon protein